MSSKYVLEISGENREIACTEIKYIERTYQNFDIVECSNKYVIVEGNPDKLRNSAFVNFISMVIDENTDYLNLSGKEMPDGLFYVRVSGAEKDQAEKLESEIGKIIGGTGRISFKNPDFRIRAVLIDKWYLCMVVYERNKKAFEDRRAPMRPFFSPVSLHPKYARYLVNTSVTLEGETVLDPFCGTGGILIEAALLGRKIIGNDSSLNMVMGTKLNFKYFKIEDYKVYNKDISELDPGYNVDAIITDMPYGRSSGIDNHDIIELYRESFKKFYELLKSGRRCSIIINNIEFLEYARNYFSIENVVPVYQHRSLVRQFVVLKRLN
jgi:tRNA (guanine10-N2)-dimethyltransferase